MKFPEDVGIIAIECVFPSQYVDQKELETFDGVAPGKYTIGLGQGKMGFCTDIEDINSLCLTAVNNLMERHAVNYKSIGRLEVGTETILDKSKSVKTVLMQLFVDSGNMDVEGVDTTNACYGGTAALFNSIAWVESSAWDKRYALVVMGDIAVYSKGNARPTGGAGAIAMLVGPNAPLIFDQGNRATYMQHTYDFYKPDLSSEYPVVDGKLSIQCYLGALDQCYQLFCKKSVAKLLLENNSDRITLKNLDAVLFHAPYCKLVQKSLARLLLNDFKQATESEIHEYPGLESFRNTPLEDIYFNRDVEKASLQLSAKMFETKTKPSLLLANQVGNMYTPSLYGGLVSLLINESPLQLSGKRVGLFSYGSGLASSMFSLRISDSNQPGSPLVKLCDSLAEVHQRLAARRKCAPEEFVQIMESREQTHHLAPYQPKTSPDTLFPGTWFLRSIDDMYRREYDRIPSLIQNHSFNSVLSTNIS